MRHLTGRPITLILRCGAFVLLASAASVTPAGAQLTQDIDLTKTGGMILQTQKDYRWGAFLVGPSDKFVGGTPAINFASCGCLLTSLSTAAETIIASSVPWWAHDLFSPLLDGTFTSAFSMSPKYINDYANVGPNLASPRPAGWGFITGSGGTECKAGLWPWAATGLGNDILGYSGVSWVQRDWDATSRAKVDSGLLQGYPSITIRRAGNGFHATLIVGWDNSQKKYLIYDPMTTPYGWAGYPGVRVMGEGWPTAVSIDDGYAQFQAAIVAVLPIEPRFADQSSWFSVSDDPEPIQFRLTDPRGRRTGYDPSTGARLQESDTAFYSEFTSFADPLGLVPESAPFRYLAARNPEPGVYGLEVFGTGTGPYKLTLGTAKIDQKQDVATVSGTITPGEIKRYEILWTASGTASIALVPGFAPHARAGNDVSTFVGGTVAFDGRGSYQVNGAIATYSWAFGDGSTASGAQQTHTFLTAGTRTATLTVTNGDGLTASDDRTIVVIDPAVLAAIETIRVDTTSAGAQALGGVSTDMQITPDGRYVVFQSYATNLLAGDTNNKPDIFVKDLVTGAVDRASVGTGGVQATGLGNGSSTASISGDGRFVAFYSDMDNLAPGSAAFADRLYVHDRVSGVTELIANQTTSGQNIPYLSGDGRYLIYATAAGFNLRDRLLGGTDQAFAGRSGRISADGRFIAYVGFNGVNGVIDVYDRETGLTEIVSRTPSGAVIPANSFDPSISGDGRYVAFDVDNGVQVIPGLYNGFGLQDVFVRDRLAGTTARVSVSSTGEGADLGAGSPALSADGRYISFYSSSDNLAPNGVLRSLQVYRRDQQTGTTERSSVSSDGTAASPAIYDFGGLYVIWPAFVASDGSVVFAANASNLVADDTNGTMDVFIRRPAPGSGTGAATTPLANLGGPYVGWATSAAVPAAIRLDGSGSIDPSHGTLTATWDFGDGSPVIAAPIITSHAYAKAGIYQVTLTVTAGSAVSAPVHTEVEVLAAAPQASLAAATCAAPGGTLWLDGAAPGANAVLLANGWDTSSGPLSPARVTIALPWGDTDVPTTLPGLTFHATLPVPADFTGSFLASVTFGTSATFAVPCATPSNLRPLAVAGGPIYSAQASVPVTLDGSASSDPEHAQLTYQWDFGDGKFGAGVTPVHTYPTAGTFLVTLIVNDGVLDSSATIGTRSFAEVIATAAPASQTFPFQGFFAPTDNTPVINARKAGSAIPMKFSLGGDRGLNVFAAGYPKSTPVACTFGAAVDGTDSTATPGGSGFTYDPLSGTYQYVWKTEKSWAGTCRQFVIKLTDGTFHRANFKFN